jgi:hypothetical protein
MLTPFLDETANPPPTTHAALTAAPPQLRISFSALDSASDSAAASDSVSDLFSLLLSF